MKKDDLMFAAFFSRSVAYAKNPRVPGGYFFDLESMEPLINGPGFVEALTDWVEATKYVPPVGINFGVAQLINSFGVWNRSSGAWENEYNQAPYIVWGWTAAVAKASKNQDVAFDYLCFFAPS